MPASIEIEFPHPGDIAATPVLVGGSYDCRDLTRTQGGKEIPILEKDTLGVGDKIVCQVFKPDMTPLGGASEFNFAALSPAVGPWSLSVTVPAGDNPDCIIRATLQVGTMPTTGYPKDTVEDVDINAAAGGTVVVIPIPPPKP